MIIDGSQLIAKLQKIRHSVPLAVKQRTYTVVERIAYEISNPTSSSWVQPKYFSGPDKGQKYFSKHALSPGLFDALSHLKSTISVEITDDNVFLGVGNIARLDAETAMKEGKGYWRLFEGYEPYFGSRVGKSNTHHFNPYAGPGKLGEGSMQEGGFHPGVATAHMFTVTLKAYKPKLISEIKLGIKEGLNAK
jgi:hypothetical protein